MAYDASAAYSAPKRAYYQPPQSTPIQNEYGSLVQEQYDQFYGDRSSGLNYGGYEQSVNQGNGYDDVRDRERSQVSQVGPESGYADTQRSGQPQSQQHANGYGESQFDDRRYDPRYQQRPDMSNPRDATTYAPGPQSQALAAAPRMGKTGRRGSSPEKKGMDDWKAKEKAKMHAAAMSPEMRAQDNAFPTLWTQRERAGSRAGTASSRPSVDASRPQTAASSRDDRKYSWDQSYGEDIAPNSSRTSFEQNPYAREVTQQARTGRFQVVNPDMPDRDRTSPTRSLREQQPAPAELRSDWNQREAPLWDGGISYADYPQATSPVRRSPNKYLLDTAAELPAMARTSPPPMIDAPAEYPEPAELASRTAPSISQQSQTRRAPQAIDTGRIPQSASLAYMSHQPLSPAVIPPQPSTSQGQSSGQSAPFAQRIVSPVSTSPVASTLHEYDNRYARQPTQQRPAQRPGDQRHFEGGYDGYQPHPTSPPKMKTQYTTRSPTREEQIEADMPDFDSAAPGGTSLLSKRGQPQAQPQPSRQPAMPPQHEGPSAYAYAPSDQNSHTQYWNQGQPPPQGSRMPPQTTPINMYNGRAYDRPNPRDPRQYGDGYTPSASAPPNQQQQPRPPPNMDMQPQTTTSSSRQYANQQQRPPQPPFANEQPRRSLDDARQMPYRQAPPSTQRAQMGSPPGPRSIQRPPGQPFPNGMRNGHELSVQTSWAVPPPQDRIGSAPPTQPISSQAPFSRMQNDQQLTRQTSAPEAPPATQPMRPSNPDALPQHPTPIRPGHAAGFAQPGKPAPGPAPIRNHTQPLAQQPPQQHQRRPSSSLNNSTRPVTVPELDQLHTAVEANPRDYKRALLLVKKLIEASTVLASEAGRADARLQAQNRERYTMEADKRLRKLVASGYAEAQFFLADCYGQGTLGLPINAKEAFTLYQAAAKAGHGQAAYRTAMCCELGPEDGGTSKDYGKAVQWYRRGAALGDADAMFKIGMILLKGLLGQQRNIGEAITWMKRAAEQSGQGNPHALFELAQLYESSQTSPEIRNKVVADDRYAFELFQQAAAAGHKASQFRLGQAYEYGQLGAAINNRMSITWYTKAAAQGDHQAELALSGWYLTGSEGILQQSDTEAYLWARKAAGSEPPLAKALFALGYFSESGIGCPKSVEEAVRWYGKAAGKFAMFSGDVRLRSSC